MGYSRDVKHRAMVLYAEGQSIEQITHVLRKELRSNVAVSTVHRWRELSQPGDWEAFRSAVEESARAETAKRLARERAKMSARHFDDLEAMRSLVKHSGFELEERDGKKVAVARTRKPREVRDVIESYKTIVTTQRLVLGMSTENVEAAVDDERIPVIVIPSKDEQFQTERASDGDPKQPAQE